MKKSIYLLLVGISLMVVPNVLSAHHWRVSNIPGATATYTSLQAAHDSPTVLAGDTLYLEPSSSSYGNLPWTKRLVIIGNGYNLGTNPETQANASTSFINSFGFLKGSNGSILIGCEINYIGISSTATPNYDTISNIVIMRNLIHRVVFQGSAGGNNIHFIQNDIYGNADLNNLIGGEGPFAEVNFENNIIYQTTINWGGAVGCDIKMKLYNNVIRGNIYTTGNIFFYNNIVYNCNLSPNSTGSYNNIGDAAQFGTSNGNQSNVNMNDVFVCYSNCNAYSLDAMYTLKPGSVAIGAGFGGIDCGIFAGNYPYVLSGLPPVPAVYYLNVQPNGNSLDVNVKIKSHN